MRIGTIYAVSLALYIELELGKSQFPPSKPELWGVQQECCAGTILGQEAYKLIVTDIFGTLGAEVGAYVFLAKLSKDGKVEVDLALALIYLCYRQGLIFIGMLFAPPLAFMGMLGAFLSFMVYYGLAFYCFKPPESKLSSQVSSVVFMQTLGLTLILTSPIVILILRVYEPNCGAFADSGYATIGSGLESWARSVGYTDPATGLMIAVEAALNGTVGEAAGAGEAMSIPVDAEVVYSESWVVVLISDTAVLYAVIFVLGIAISFILGKARDREEQCLQMAYALDVAHAELEAKKNVIFFNEFTYAASRVEVLLTERIERARAAGSRSAPGTIGIAVGRSSGDASDEKYYEVATEMAELNIDDVAALEAVQCCMTYDGVEMLQACNYDEIVSSKSGAWLHELLTAPSEIISCLREDWLQHSPDGTRCAVKLAIYPSTYASANTWAGLFSQLYTSHQAVWELSQHVTAEMFKCEFAVLEAAAADSYLNGRTFEEAYEAGESDDGFMTTERLLDRATQRREEGAAHGTAHSYKAGLITAAELRGWLYHKLGVTEDFGQAEIGGGDGEVVTEWLIANRAVSEFGEVFYSYDITDLLDPPQQEDEVHVSYFSSSSGDLIGP